MGVNASKTTIVSDSMALVLHKHPISQDYTLEQKEVGSGGFGSVVKCTSKKSGTVRACKKMLKRKVNDREMFAREVALQLSLDHPHICRVYDCYEDSKCYYIVLELCEGGELFDRIIEDQRFHEKGCVGLVDQMLRGLNYLHLQCVAHRDLKPENFLIHNKDAELSDVHLKLIDFGMAKRFEKSGLMDSWVCTPYYVAPEILAGKVYKETVDVWSLGVITYIMLCGEPPFGGSHDNAIFDKVKVGRFAFSQTAWRAVSDQAKAFVQACLTLKPVERPSIADLLSHDWILSRETASEAVLSRQCAQSLKSFQRKGKLQRSALGLIAKYLPQEKVGDLQSVFEHMDKEKRGVVTLGQVKGALEDLGMQDKVRKSIINDLDVDESSQLVKYSEFVAMTMERKDYMKECYVWEVFRKFDVRNNGAISKDDLAVVLTGGERNDFASALELEKAEIEDMLAEANQAEDGEIKFDDFMHLMQQSTTTRRTLLGRGTLVSQPDQKAIAALAAAQASEQKRGPVAKIMHKVTTKLRGTRSGTGTPRSGTGTPRVRPQRR